MAADNVTATYAKSNWAVGSSIPISAAAPRSLANYMLTKRLCDNFQRRIGG
jgi:hypothetical protein